MTRVTGTTQKRLHSRHKGNDLHLHLHRNLAIVFKHCPIGIENIKERLPALVPDLFTFSSKAIKMFIIV
jgi:hypothetical protein